MFLVLEEPAQPFGVTAEEMAQPEFQLAHEALHGKVLLTTEQIPEGMTVHDFGRKFSKEGAFTENAPDNVVYNFYAFRQACLKLKVPPPCAFWSIWAGKEIEGEHELNEQTLFVRSFGDEKKSVSPLGVFQRAREEGIDRVWFTEEYMLHGSDHTILDAISLFRQVCVCVNLVGPRSQILPQILSHEKVRMYYKVDMSHHYPIRAGDVVCFGEKFADEAFTLGTVGQVSRERYAQDVRWL